MGKTNAQCNAPMLQLILTLCSVTQRPHIQPLLVVTQRYEQDKKNPQYS